jgi:4-hydroxy-tetrahydrodipicolinate reductase
MKIALIGHGNMGKEIEQLVQDQAEHTIVSISCSNTTPTLDKAGVKKADVAIDFTSPEIVVNNIREVAKLGIPLVVGTTGWYKHLKEVTTIAHQTDIGLVYGQNFSIGANIFFRIVAYASELTAQYSNYDIAGFEIHHTGKKDSPSGTAKKLTEIIRQNTLQKKPVNFSSVRVGTNPGRHEVLFDSTADEITLTHAARSRRGFAQGAIHAAEFIKGKKGVYNFDALFEGEKV